MNSTIELINVTTGYKDKAITRDINATLQAGELTCLLGPNGAGKTTLLKTLCAFLPPLSGEIRIHGTDIRKLNARRLSRIIGVVLTERPAGMNMTVEELVAIGRSPYTSFLGGLKAEDKAVVDEAIALVGIEPLRTRSVHTLSDGERQKALIAKALAQQTQIIFLDEPTAFLDYPSKVDIMKLLYRIAREENKTIFMSTHDLELATQIADKIWLLDRDHGLNIGIPEDLAYHGLFGKYFERGGLKFNRETGSFEIEHDKLSTARVRGVGTLANMVRKALKRNGIVIKDDGVLDIEVMTRPDGREVILFGNHEMEYIEELIYQIKQA